MTTSKKLLYVASTASHLQRFHQPYIRELRRTHTVLTMANGKGVDASVPFAKSFFSPANLGCVFKIRKFIRKEGFDAILVHTSLAAFLVRLSLFGMRRRPYVMNVVHGYLFQKAESGLKARFLRLCERMMKGKTDDIAVMNRDDLEIAQAQALCRGKVFMMRGMGIPQSTAYRRDLAVREALGIPADALLCIFVGELSRRKNQAFLIDAAARLAAEGLPIYLLLLGEGSEREGLEEQVRAQGLAGRVILAGNREPVAPYLSVADLYLSASRSEGLPFNIMEAMDAGLPILASDTKGQTDLLEAYPHSLYPHGDLDALCQAIRTTAEGGRLGVGACAYPTLENYRLSAVFDENLKLFTEGWAHDEDQA